MKHARTIDFDYVKILAILQITIKRRLRSVKKKKVNSCMKGIWIWNKFEALSTSC